jgi:para-aminobenzoate synthetase component 1
MKGTARRDLENPLNDEALKNTLYSDAKERAENVMIVDLVRNDLSRICDEATVKVDELFGIYTYPQVHQMVSTISGILKADVSFSDIINATFPMGSMTGLQSIK